MCAYQGVGNVSFSKKQFGLCEGNLDLVLLYDNKQLLSRDFYLKNSYFQECYEKNTQNWIDIF